MKIKLTVLVALLGVGLLAIGIIRTAATATQKKNVPYKDRLEWYAKEAKNQGRQKVTMPAPLLEYMGGAKTITAEEVFSDFSVVIAHLVSQQSYPQNADIKTWNKFAIDEVLSDAKDLPCPTCKLSDPPATLLPLNSGEFLMSKAGGTVNIDGVNIEQIDETFPEFEFNQKYVLLIKLYSNGTAWTVGGPVGVFKILHNDKVLPVRESGHQIQKDFKEKHGNSLERLRAHLKRR